MTRAWRGYLLAGIPLTIAYLWLPVETAKLVLWPVMGWSSVIAILIGVRVNRPPSPARLVPARCRRGHPADGRQPLQRSRSHPTLRDAVPLVRRRRLSGDVPAVDRRPGAARPSPIGRSRPSRCHRRRHHHGGPGTGLVGPAHRSVRPDRRPHRGRASRLDRLSRWRRRAPRHRGPVGGRWRSPSRRVLAVGREPRAAARRRTRSTAI